MPDFLADRWLWLESLPIAEAVVIGLAFAWGAVLGSFANVVLYRLPRGESVVAGGSRCPACGSAIRARDNVPVLGWLLLRGRCRDCGAAISGRYPLIEAACGGIAATIAAAEIAGGGRWLPLLGGGRQDIDRLLLHGEWRLVAAWALHTLLLITMLTWSLLERDRASSWCPGWATAAVGIIAVVAAVPAIGPPSMLFCEHSSPRGEPRVHAVAASCVGLLAGRIWGGITAGAADRCGLSIFGAAAGWQAVTVVAVVTAAARRVARVCLREEPRGFRPFEPLIWIATAQVVFGRPIHDAWVAACRLAGGG
jgi:prepilin signal peptidase PulO-like enzyme (type II secretory pathway)